jgi:GTP pyrophosphokinase
LPAEASILLELGLDSDTIIASIIHDSQKKPSLSSSSIDQIDQFGPIVTRLVNGLTKIDSLKTNSKTLYEAQNIRNMLFALTDDIRVIFIKLAEKLKDLRILDSSNEETKTLARECLDIYAPLADRLGISWIKNEMEDLSLKFLNREVYQQIKNLVAEKRGQRNQFLIHAQERIKNEVEAAGINITVESRAKHFYSVYMKMRKRGISADKIFDLSGIRIICDSIENCYTLLGIVHSLWRPLSGCFKDYIANPKPNGYRSLHTTVICENPDETDSEEGKLLEIQIRTWEMHQIAEFGVASHWLYKKGSSRDMIQPEEIGIVNKLKNWKQNEDDDISPLWLEEIKRDILQKWTYVFTPQGKVIKLPAGATPIDFAYCIHTAVGEHCIGAKANGQIIPLSSPLKNTQIVEIMTSSSARPHQNWLQLAKSSRTRSKIRSWLEKNDESYSIDKIQEAPAETKKSAASKSAASKMRTLEAKKSEASALSSTVEKRDPVQKVTHSLSSFLQVRVEDEKNMMIRFARCCNPITGDSIIGYVSRGRGVIIHRKNCRNLANNPELENRKIDAEWEKAGSALLKRFRIEAKFSANLFSEIEGAIRKRQGHLIEGRLDETPTSRLIGTFTMQLVKEDDLKTIVKNIRGIPGILAIQTIS